MEKSPQYDAPAFAPQQEQQQQQFQPQMQQPQQPQQFQQQQQQYQQPQMQQPMMAYHPNPLNKAIKEKSGKREWSHGLCNCCDVPSACLLAWCCPCISYGQTKERFKARINNEAPSEPACCSTDAILWYVVQMVACGCLLDCSLRGEMQKRYNIEGNSCTNCMTASCCHVCMQTQHAAEVREEEQMWVAQNSGQHVEH